MIRNMLMELEDMVDCVNINFQSDCLLLGIQSKVYQPLMKREMCGSYTILSKLLNKNFPIKSRLISQWLSCSVGYLKILRHFIACSIISFN